MSAADGPARIGHEFIGIVEDTGSEVSTVTKGDLVVAPLAYSVGTLVKLPVAAGSALIPSLLTLSDVLGTGYHAAVKAGIKPGDTVTVIGDGALGLLAVLAAKRLGAEQIILMGRHRARTDLGREFGATDVVSERGEEGIAEVRDPTGGDGSRIVLGAVGHMAAYQQAYGIVRPGGVISRVGVPQYEDAPIGSEASSAATSPSPAAPPPHVPTSRSSSRHPRGQDRAREGLRPDRRPRRRPGCLPSHGRPRSTQGPRTAVTCLEAPGALLADDVTLTTSGDSSSLRRSGPLVGPPTTGARTRNLGGRRPRAGGERADSHRRRLLLHPDRLAPRAESGQSAHGRVTSACRPRPLPVWLVEEVSIHR
jgi:hypothetical protein